MEGKLIADHRVLFLTDGFNETSHISEHNNVAQAISKDHQDPDRLCARKYSDDQACPLSASGSPF